MAEQKMIFTIKQQGDKNSVKLEFDPPLHDKDEFAKLSPEEKSLQCTASDVATHVMNALKPA